MARKLLLAGVNRWPPANDELEIDQTITYQGSAATFQVTGAEPMRGEEVIIEDDDLPGEDKRLFAGIVVSAETVDHIGEGADRREIWAVECDDYRNQMDRYLVNEIYEGWTSDAIAIDLLQKYCPGFTWNGVQAGGATVEKIWFDDVYPSEAFRQLCEYTGRVWYVDFYRDVKFFDPEELSEAAPMVLRPGGAFDNFRMSIDIQDLANRVKVKGGAMLSDVFTYEIKSDGTARIWVLPHKPHELEIYVSEAQKTVGIEYVHEEADFDFLVNFQEKYVRCSAQTATPVEGATITFRYRYDIPVITVVDDIESQEAVAAVQGGDGVYEVVITDTSIRTLDAAEAAGFAYLREHANPTVQGSFSTTVPGWRPGQLVEIRLPERGADGVYMVRRVKIRPFWPSNPSLWTWTVEFGGRLKGIPELLKALLSAEQKRDLAETALLQKYAYGQDETAIEDEIVATPVELPMVVEESKVVVFTLDGFVEDEPTFTRTSVAYKQDGTQVAANVPRYEDGKFDKAVLVEEGTTNLIGADGDFENDSNSDGIANGWYGWSGVLYGAVPSLVSDPWTGLKAQRITSTSGDTGAARRIEKTIAITGGQTYTFSAYLKTDGVATGRLRIDTNGTAPVVISSVLNSPTQYERREVSFTAPADATQVIVRCYNNILRGQVGWVQWDGAQLEQKPYPTSFTPGTRAAETLTIPTAGVLNPQEGAMECWFYYKPCGMWQRIVSFVSSLTTHTINNHYDLQLDVYPTGLVRFQPFREVDGSSVAIKSTTPITKGWHFVACKWSPSGIALVVDNQEPVNDSYSGGIAALDTSFSLGKDHKREVAYLNAPIDDLRISSRARTDQEIADAYASGQPLPVDEWTTYKLAFDGTLTPGGEIQTEFPTIGSRLNVTQANPGDRWPQPEISTSEDGETWSDWRPVGPLERALPVPYPGLVRIRALGRIKAYNYKRPFDETLVVCGVVEVG